MNIIGISYGYHDSAVALLVDGQPAYFFNEERFSHSKNDPGFPLNAIRQVRQYAGSKGLSLDGVIYYEDPVLKADRIARFARTDGTLGAEAVSRIFRQMQDRETLAPRELIAARLGVGQGIVHNVSHHEAHAGLAFFMSPFQRALVITLDGVGEDETLGVWIGEGTKLTKIRAMKLPHSVGLLYSTITAFCGFAINEGEYKLMGLAAFGEPEFAGDFREWMHLDAAEMRCAVPHLHWSTPSAHPFGEAFLARFGQPFRSGTDDHLDPRFANLAASVQLVLEEETERLVTGLMRETGIGNVCLGGGVALNCTVNGRLRRSVCENLFVPTAPGDAGSALGGALAWMNRQKAARGLTGKAPVSPVPYLGTELDLDYLETVDAVYRPLIRSRELREAAPEQEIAALLADGKVLGHMFGRFEMGPRALGHRSILADPRSLEMKERVNEKIKHREAFRPFAPAILEEQAARYFAIPASGTLGDHAPEHYMLATYPALPRAREEIPAAIHVDGTARVQIVSERNAPRFHRILSAFHELTGVPVLLNTSLNVAGQPMASSVWSGLVTLLQSDLDGLVVGNRLLEKR